MGDAQDGQHVGTWQMPRMPGRPLMRLREHGRKRLAHANGINAFDEVNCKAGYGSRTRLTALGRPGTADIPIPHQVPMRNPASGPILIIQHFEIRTSIAESGPNSSSIYSGSGPSASWANWSPDYYWRNYFEMRIIDRFKHFVEQRTIRSYAKPCLRMSCLTSNGAVAAASAFFVNGPIGRLAAPAPAEDPPMAPQTCPHKAAHI